MCESVTEPERMLETDDPLSCAVHGDSRLICPLTAVPCLKESCAWWNPNSGARGACAVLLLPTHADVRGLLGALEDLDCILGIRQSTVTGDV